MFTVGHEYVRRRLHGKYGGQMQGGISTPAQHSFIMLFSGEQGEEYGYRDGWAEGNRYLYTGEGQVGDMAFIRGNELLRDHVGDGKDVHLFEYVQRGIVRYVGQVVCTGYTTRTTPDINGHPDARSSSAEDRWPGQPGPLTSHLRDWA